MRLYILYVLLLAAIIIAAIEAVPNLADRWRRFLVIAVALLVVLPGVLYLLFGGT